MSWEVEVRCFPGQQKFCAQGRIVLSLIEPMRRRNIANHLLNWLHSMIVLSIASFLQSNRVILVKILPR